MIFIDTGARPAIPSIPGLEPVDYLTNASLMELTELPEHLLILGGGCWSWKRTTRLKWCYSRSSRERDTG